MGILDGNKCNPDLCYKSECDHCDKGNCYCPEGMILKGVKCLRDPCYKSECDFCNNGECFCPKGHGLVLDGTKCTTLCDLNQKLPNPCDNCINTQIGPHTPAINCT